MRERNSREKMVAATRNSILDAAERLYAERGIMAVSNRHVSDAAGQGNNTAVGYHFGERTDLLRAILDRHESDIERRRTARAKAMSDTPSVRELAECMVLPNIEHLQSLEGPTWYARISAQVISDPVLRTIYQDIVWSSPSLLIVRQGILHHFGNLDNTVRKECGDMTRIMVMHSCAERERDFFELHYESLTQAERLEPPADEIRSWKEVGDMLVNTVEAIWNLAPKSRRAQLQN